MDGLCGSSQGRERRDGRGWPGRLQKTRCGSCAESSVLDDPGGQDIKRTPRGCEVGAEIQFTARTDRVVITYVKIGRVGRDAPGEERLRHGAVEQRGDDAAMNGVRIADQMGRTDPGGGDPARGIGVESDAQSERWRRTADMAVRMDLPVKIG